LTNIWFKLPDTQATMSDTKRVSVQEGYDLWSETYDTTPNPVVAMDARHTVALLQPQVGERILDAGCGTGRNLKALLEAGAIPPALISQPGCWPWRNSASHRSN
jgi:SAM-dependent methyltransferase